jgi:heparin/heparan-sulfate lyase
MAELIKHHLLTEEYQTGEILAHGLGPDAMVPDYTYLKSDITRAYSRKVKSVKPSFCFLNLGDTSVPAALIVYDKVVSSKCKLWTIPTRAFLM